MDERRVENRYLDVALVEQHSHLGTSQYQTVSPPFDQPLRDRDIGRLAPLRGNVQAQLFIYDAMGLGTVRVIWQNGV